MLNPLLDNPSSADARGKRIRYVRDHLLSLTREAFCAQSELTVPALKGWELGWGGGLTQQGAEKIVKRAKDLNVYCSEYWLLHGIGRDPVFLTKDFDIEENAELQIAKELLLFRGQPNAIDAIVKDDGMVPALYPGTYVGGIIAQDLKQAIEHDCIIIDEDDTTYIRLLKQGDQDGLFHLYCLNQNTTLVKKEIKNTRIKIAAPIVWIRKNWTNYLPAS